MAKAYLGTHRYCLPEKKLFCGRGCYEFRQILPHNDELIVHKSWSLLEFYFLVRGSCTAADSNKL